jgi:hypothetical protein
VATPPPVDHFYVLDHLIEVRAVQRVIVRVHGDAEITQIAARSIDLLLGERNGCYRHRHLHDTPGRGRPHGGRVVMERARIPDVGDLMFFADPSGNIAGAMRYG